MIPEDRELMLQTLELGDPKKVMEEERLDRRRARIENDLFVSPRVDEQGRPAGWPEVDPDDNHAVHKQEHRLLKKSDIYAQWDVTRRLAFDAHIATHDDYLVMAMEAQMAMQGASAAGPQQGSQPAEKGAPSPPKRKSSESAGE
jgi:hypothetical protein